MTAISSDSVFCAELARDRDFTAYASSLFVSPDVRRGWLALTAFNAEVAHIRDHISQPLPGEIRLQWWRDMIGGVNADSAHDSPVAAETLRAVSHYGLSRDVLTRLIDAWVFDVYDDPMPDMAALEAHIRDTASAVFAMRAQILGAKPSDVSRLADHAGLAEGLTGIMLMLPGHAARRQLYLPADLLAYHGVSAGDVFARRGGAALSSVLEHLRGEAGRQLERATALLSDIPITIRPAFLSLAVIPGQLKLLEGADPFDVQSTRHLATLWTLWRARRSRAFRS